MSLTRIILDTLGGLFCVAYFGAAIYILAEVL